MVTRVEISTIPVLVDYLNNLVTCKLMTSEVAQCLLLQMSTKLDFGKERVEEHSSNQLNDFYSKLSVNILVYQLFDVLIILSFLYEEFLPKSLQFLHPYIFYSIY